MKTTFKQFLEGKQAPPVEQAIKRHVLHTVKNNLAADLNLPSKSVAVQRELGEGPDSLRIDIVVPQLVDVKQYGDKLIDAASRALSTAGIRARFDGIDHHQKGVKYLDNHFTLRFAAYPA